MLLQTPYLVLSDPAQQMFRALHAAHAAAARDRSRPTAWPRPTAFIAYALSYKYKRRYLREFGFEIYEYKPFPADAPIDLAAIAAGAAGRQARARRAKLARAARRRATNARRQRRLAAAAADSTGAPLQSEYAALRCARRNLEPVPLQRAGVRIGLHAKSLVVDERIGVVGTHNFDPRGDRYNTESAVVIDDPAFARALADSIRGDMRRKTPGSIAPRDKAPVFSGLDYSLAKMSERLPIFDLWPCALRHQLRVPSPAPTARRRCRATTRASARATARSATSPRSTSASRR